MKRLIAVLCTFLFMCLLPFSNVFSQPAIDGDLSDSDYITIALKNNANNGFGNNIDVSRIVYFPDTLSQVLYFGIIGKIDQTSDNNGIGIWLNLSQENGVASGTSLGANPGGHYMSGNGGSNGNFKADFEVDYMFALNTGNSANLYVDAVKLVGGRASQYLGNCGLSGTSTPNINSDFFSSGSVTFAFNNGGGANQGFEASIPFSELGANVTKAGTFEIFTFVVSPTAFFSDVTVPGNITIDNPGFNTDFGAISGDPYHAMLGRLGDSQRPEADVASVSGGVADVTFTDNFGIKKVTLKSINNVDFSVEGNSLTTPDETYSTIIPPTSITASATKTGTNASVYVVITDILGTETTWFIKFKE